MFLMSWTNTVTVSNGGTGTDQFTPAITVNPAGTELFIGYYSRQSDPVNNALIIAYGAKAPITAGSVTKSTFDCFPISTVGFYNLFNGTDASTPPTSPWLYDHVYVPGFVCMDTNATVVEPFDWVTWEDQGGFVTPGTYDHFPQDDNTWAVADSYYFYYAWRDCSDTCTNTLGGVNYIRPDANVRFGKIRQ